MEYAVYTMNDANRFELQFRSPVQCDRQTAWSWITSVDGIAREMRPFFRMSVPAGVRSITDVDIVLGTPLFRSRVFLFGVLPIDRLDLTLLELHPERGFVEQSPMRAMRLWRHEREILDSTTDPPSVVIEDRVTFEPRWAKRVVAWFIRRMFVHRHRVLAKNLALR